MKIYEKLYDKSPIWIQNIAITISGYLRNRSRYGNVYYKHREFLKKFDSLTLDSQKDYQLSELKKFLDFSIKNSPYYKEKYKNIDISSINSVKDLERLPIISKEDIRQNIDKIITIKRKNAVEGHTGGTTGKSLVVLFTKEDMMKRMAVLDHFKSRVGFEHLIMKRATFNGKHIIPPGQKANIFWRFNKACKQMIYSSFHLSEENMKHYVNSLNKFKPEAIDGFFMSICDIASYINRNNIQLTFTPKAIFPTSETLTKTGRELIEKVFNCKVFDQYASSEGAPFITECINQKLHVELSTGVFEIMDDSTDEVLVTSFSTHGTPLIRYKIGDSVRFGKAFTGCSCGIHSQTVEYISGRTLDFVYTANFVKINGGNVANLFKNMPNALIRAQVIQNVIGKIEILLEVDKRLYLSQYDDLLKDEFLHKFGSTTEIIIRHVDEIPREISGKFKLIKNNVGLL